MGHAGEAGVQLRYIVPPTLCRRRPLPTPTETRKVASSWGPLAPVISAPPTEFAAPILGEPENAGKGKPFRGSGWSWWSQMKGFHLES